VQSSFVTLHWREMDSKFQFRARWAAASWLLSGWGRSIVGARCGAGSGCALRRSVARGGAVSGWALRRSYNTPQGSATYGSAPAYNTPQSNAPQANQSGAAQSASARRNVIESRQYDREVETNRAFRQARMRKECGPITDPELRQSCLASFNQEEPQMGSSTSNRSHGSGSGR
jgi:hypothetical protein